MNARPGPLEGLAMFAGGVAVLALMFAVQAGALSGFNPSQLMSPAGDAEIADGGPGARG